MATWKLATMFRASVTVLQLFIVSTCAAAGHESPFGLQLPKRPERGTGVS